MYDLSPSKEFIGTNSRYLQKFKRGKELEAEVKLMRSKAVSILGQCLTCIRNLIIP